MAMTQKQAREYVANDSGNWKLVEETDHVRMYVLEYEGVKYARLDVLCCLPVWARVTGKELTDEWRNELYLTIEEGGHLCYAVRPTEMARTIWERSKA